METKHMNESILIKIFPWMLKVFAAIIGAIFSLILSGDIDKDGKLQISQTLIIKLLFGISLSLFGGQAFIEYYHLTDRSIMTHGFVMLIFAVFGLLIIGIIYQAIKLMQGKTLSEIVLEIRETFRAIFK